MNTTKLVLLGKIPEPCINLSMHFQRRWAQVIITFAFTQSTILVDYFQTQIQTSLNWFSCIFYTSYYKTYYSVKHSSFLFNYNKHLYPTSKVLNVYTIYRHRKKNTIFLISIIFPFVLAQPGEYLVKYFSMWKT